VRLRREDELKPGVDKPTRRQYVIGAVVIAVFAVITYWWLAHH
jgi:hypothetical protein